MTEVNRELTDTTSIPNFIYQRRNILVKEGIITDQRVIECSTERILIEKDYINGIPRCQKRIKRCNLVHSCPICAFRQDLKDFARTKPYVNLLNQNDGEVHLLTYTLRHSLFHRYEDLTRVLYKSVKQMNQTYPYKKYYGKRDRFFSFTRFEDSWNPITGHHPHAHILIGTTSIATKEEIESEMKPKWVDVVSKNTCDSSMIPTKESGLVLLTGLDSVNYPFKGLNHSWNEEEDIETWLEKEKRVRETSKMFIKPKSLRKEETEDLLVIHHEEEKPESSIINKIIQSLKIIYFHCSKRYLSNVMTFRSYFQVNKRHNLFQTIEDDNGSPISSLKNIATN